VELAVETDTPIKEDTRADIVTMGITGLKAIEIRGGSNEARTLQTGEFINPGTSTTEEISGKANIIAEKTEKVINNLQLFTDPDNMNRFTAAADNINLLAGQFNETVVLIDSVIGENRLELRETIKTSHQIAGRLDESSRALNEAVVSINSIIQGDTIQRILGNANMISEQLRESDLQLLIQNLAEMADQTRLLLYKIDGELELNSQEFSESIQLLRVTLSNLEQTSNRISSDPSILVRGSGEKNIPDRRLKK
jgi:phospholipid/cholesterol/gamma-HCH transport system substrate-binding protein